MRRVVFGGLFVCSWQEDSLDVSQVLIFQRVFRGLDRGCDLVLGVGVGGG